MEKNIGRTILRVYNQHVKDCGVPPKIRSNEEAYVGYFENEFGEQWMIYRPSKKSCAFLRGGDIGWDKVIAIRKKLPGIVLGYAERVWLQACIKAMWPEVAR